MESKTTTTAKATTNVPSVTVTIPTASVADGTFGTRDGQFGHVEARLSPKQHSALTRIRVGLDKRNARLEWPVDRVVQTNTDAVRWILEHAADAINGSRKGRQ